MVDIRCQTSDVRYRTQPVESLALKRKQRRVDAVMFSQSSFFSALENLLVSSNGEKIIINYK